MDDKKKPQAAAATPKKEGIFSSSELQLIKATFSSESLLRLLRKVFLPPFDYDAPLGQAVDVWLTLNLEQMTPYDRELAILARTKLITYVERRLLDLQILAGMPEETLEERAKRQAKDSTQ